MLSVLVVLSVIAVLGISAGVWFFYHKQNPGSNIFTAFEYHPPFRVLETDRSCLVDAEEMDSIP